MAVLFQKMVMAGVGLICGSLALDVRRKKVVKEIVGYGRSESNLRLAKRKGIIDGYFLREDEFPCDADFLMLGTPVQTIVPIIKTFLPKISPGCVISDVGSVKGEIVRGMERLLPKNIFFIAGHPIAGSEQWGAQAARPDLFVHRRCILTPTKKTDRRALAKVAALWRKVGADVELMQPDIHDQVLGLMSHLPHVLVYALVNALERRPLRGVDLKILRRRLQGFYSHCVEPAGALARYLSDESPCSGPFFGGLHEVFGTNQPVDSRRQRRVVGARVCPGLRDSRTDPVMDVQ